MPDFVIPTIIIFVLLVIVAPLIIVIAKTWPIAKNIYNSKLVKTSDDMWSRECSCPENEEHLRMWNIGLEWRANVTSKVTEVSIENDGLKLYGEYFDNGSDKCVLIVPGRCETLMYSYYFAEGYKGANVNFLLFDPRAHGKSEGKYSYCGIKEADDVLAWAKYAKTLGNTSIILHGICIGASACFMAKEKDTENVITKIISEGCFTTFHESFRQHIICEKRPVQPVLAELRFLMKCRLHVDIKKQCPLKAVKKITIPVLFIAGQKDVFSIPAKSRELFAACKSQQKKMVWFGVGAHSHLRINNTESYDSNVVRFVNNSVK